VCGDPLSYFIRANLIRIPSAFLFGQPSLGKSTLGRRWLTGAEWSGYKPWVLGDLKPDYVDLIKAMGGQIITVGRGLAGISPLSGGTWRRSCRGSRTCPTCTARSGRRSTAGSWP
jgi:hypothetical protein